jgi:glycosyltransferase involved in cell wall biosynthesis
VNVCIITGPALARTHGTGAQLLRLFGGTDVRFFHLYWNSRPFGRSEHPRSYALENRAWTLPRGGRLARALGRRLGILWWSRNDVDARKLARLRARADLRADVAYVIVASEAECERARSLLARLGCPYVVHLMDVEHPQGLDPTTMPAYRGLLERASAVLVLNDAMAREAARFQVRDLRVVAFSCEVTPRVARPPEPGSPLRLLVAGSVQQHGPGLRLLAQAWPRILARHPAARVVYVGADQAEMTTPDLRDIVDNRGYITSADEYQRIVESCHVGYLPGPSTMNALGRFSVPSRTADFLMSGLPIVACVAAGSATETFLQPLAATCVRIARTDDAIVEGVHGFTRSADDWQAASRQAREFAVANLSTTSVRAKVFDALARAVATP